jgi:hypothetical protein
MFTSIAVFTVGIFLLYGWALIIDLLQSVFQSDKTTKHDKPKETKIENAKSQKRGK